MSFYAPEVEINHLYLSIAIHFWGLIGYAKHPDANTIHTPLGDVLCD